MLKIKNTKQFKKDIKRYQDQKAFIKELNSILCLANLESLPERYKDHSLIGNWVNYRECHVKNDILLIYLINENDELLFLERLGSHSELFR
jgi:mRNA interferase YafQ